MQPAADRIPWWIVPNLLALDAPAVAVVWQRFLGSQFRVPVPVLASVVLALVVWGIYLLDRLWDARRGDLRSDRHRYAGAYPRSILAMSLGALGAAAVCCAFLPFEILKAGALVAIGVVGYLALVHGLAPRWTGALATKELLVGTGFAAGVGVPLLASPNFSPAWLPALAAFGILCALNCRLIDRWELQKPIGELENFMAVAIALSCLATPLPIARVLFAGLVFLALVQVAFGQRRPRPARVLADVALLAPLVAAL